MHQLRFNKSNDLMFDINYYNASDEKFEATGVCSIDNNASAVAIIQQAILSGISLIEILDLAVTEISLWSSEKYNNASFTTLSVASASDNQFNFSLVLNI